MEQKFSTLSLLTSKGLEHLAQRKYSWAMVYLCDALTELKHHLETTADADEMKHLILEVKVPCHKNLSLSYLKQGNYEDCISQCEGVLEVEPNCVEILFRLGIAYLNLYNMAEAEKHLRRAYILSPHQKEIMKALQRIEELSFTPVHKKLQMRVQPKKQVEKQSSGFVKLAILSPLLVFLFFWNLLFSGRRAKA